MQYASHYICTHTMQVTTMNHRCHTLSGWGKHLTQISSKSFKELNSWHEMGVSNLWPATCGLDLGMACLKGGFCTSLHWGEQSTKIILNTSRYFGVVEWTWYLRLKPLTFNCHLGPVCLEGEFCMLSRWGAHFTQISINLQGWLELQSRQEIPCSNLWPSTVTLTLGPHI